MAEPPFDAQERLGLCVLLAELGPFVPTLLEGWTANDLAAHIVLRERDLIAGPCIVLPGAFQRFAERRRARLAESKDFASLVTRIRSGPPLGFFRIGWVRSVPNLNEFFIHHEDLRRANELGPRALAPVLEAALWRNVRRSSRYLTRRLRDAGQAALEDAGSSGRLRLVDRRHDPRSGAGHRPRRRQPRRLGSGHGQAPLDAASGKFSSKYRTATRSSVG